MTFGDAIDINGDIKNDLHVLADRQDEERIVLLTRSHDLVWVRDLIAKTIKVEDFLFATERELRLLMTRTGGVTAED